MKLFDDFHRTNSSHAAHQEGNFEFLNRIATPWWTEVRDRLETWFGAYCEDSSPAKVADLRRRFRSRDARQHLGAWWELYVYWLVRSLNPDKSIGVEPERPGYRRPDFCLAETAYAPPELWVEATTTFSGIVEPGRHGAREAYVLDTINEVQSADFRVWIKGWIVGDEQPRKRQIIAPLREWLGSLDREALLAAMERGEPRATTTLTPAGWKIVLEALPKSTPGIHPDDRLVGVGPMSLGWVNDVPQSRKTIKGKTGRYRDLAAPYAIAVLPSSPTFSAQDAAEALYGSEGVQVDPERLDEPGRLVRLPDGVWSGGEARVSGVLFGPGIYSWTAAKVWPQLWLNPHAEHPLPGGLAPVPHVEVTPEGRLKSVDPVGPPASLLGLSPDWPGSGDPFDR